MKPVRPVELFLLLACLGLLWMLWLPASTPEAAAGMDQRYTVSAQDLPTRAQVNKDNPQATARQQERALWLHSNLALYLSVLAIVGWVALLLGRLALPWSTHLLLIVPLWCGVAAWHGAMDWIPKRWGLIAAGAVGLASAGALLQRWWTGRASAPVAQTAVSVWHYPGFVLLSGLGLVWLTDLAARGTLKQLFLGVRQADSLLLAYATLTLLAATAPALLAGFARAATWLEDRLAGLSPFVAGTCVLALLSLPLVGLIGALRSGFILPSLFGESARVLFWVVSGWIMYRWVDRDRPSVWAFLLVIVFQVLLLGAYAVIDKGQAMVTLLSLCVPMAVLMVPMLLGRKLAFVNASPSRAVMAAVMWLPFVALVLFVVWTLGPQLGSHIAERLEAINAPFSAGNDFLAQLFWLSHAAGVTGFGLTHVPWCGNMGSIGSTCRGVPEQIQSDYAIQGLAAVWGMPAAIALVLALCIWLVGMFRLSPGVENQLRSTLALRAWIVAFFSVMLVTQTFVTSFGALGAMPMTGVPLPLLAYGRAGLLVIAFFAGLSMNRWVELPGPINAEGDKHV